MIRTLTLLALLAGSTAFAQVPRGHGYFVQGFGQVADGGPPFMHTAVGGEGAVWKGITIGGEAGIFYNYQNISTAIGLLNLTGGYHFTAGRKDTKWDPFVVGGPTLAVRSGAAGGFHYGGGVTYWFSRHLGVRTEFRMNHISSDYAKLPEFRIGLAFH